MSNMTGKTGNRNFVLEHKNALLSRLITLSDTWDNHDVHGLLHHVEQTFEDARGTAWEGKDFWGKLEHEEELWERECKDGQRRRGHEKDSTYDQLMTKWTRIWSKMSAATWQQRLKDKKCTWDEVPQGFRDPKGMNGYRVYQHVFGARKLTVAEWQQMLDEDGCKWEDIPAELRTGTGSEGSRVYEYSDYRLGAVVNSAAERAIDDGKPELAMAIQQIHQDCADNAELRDLVEKQLTQKSTVEENVRFRVIVEQAKKKVRAQQATSRTERSAVEKVSSEKAPPSRKATPDKRAAPPKKATPSRKTTLSQKATPAENTTPSEVTPPNENITPSGNTTLSKKTSSSTKTTSGRLAIPVKNLSSPSKTQASPEEIRYDPPGCTCSNCKGGKEWQDSTDHVNPAKQLVEAQREDAQQATAGAAPEQPRLHPRNNDATSIDNGMELDVQATNTEVENASTNAHSTQAVSKLPSISDSREISPFTKEDESLARVPSENNEDWSSKPTAPPMANMIRQQPETASMADASDSDAMQTDSSDTDQRKPHRDPLVTEILGNLQYEPAVRELLEHDQPLPSDSTVSNFASRRSALETIKYVVEVTPAARKSVPAILQKLQELDEFGRREEAKAYRQSLARKGKNKAKAPVKSQNRDAEENDEHQDHDENDEDDEEHSKDESEPGPSKTRLRARRSTSQHDVTDDHSFNRWPCPMANDTGCTTLFSKHCHAVRHAKTVHSGRKDFQCPDCGQAFARDDNMRQHQRNVHKNNKRVRESLSSTENAEVAADINIEAETGRPQKRMRTTRRDSNISWNSEKNAEQDRDKDGGAESPRESSPLTEFTSEEEVVDETAKEAYVEERLQITSGRQAREAIEAVYGPVSPTEFGDDDETMTAIADAEHFLSDGHLPSPPPPPPPPPPEEETPNDALQIICSATAAAVAKDPGIARLEAKIDSLLKMRANSTPSIKESSSAADSPASGKAAGNTKSPTEALASIAEILQSNALDGQSPEITHLLMRMARDAADATIYAGEAMRRAGELTKTVTMVLEQMCPGEQVEAAVTAATAQSTAD